MFEPYLFVYNAEAIAA